MFKGLTGNSILKTLGLAALAFLAYLVLAMLFTQFYTRHGESVKVPKVIGMPAENAFSLLDDNDLEMVIIDSVYREDMKPMTIIDQDPKENMKVKPGRKIYVTVNSGLKPKVKMPQLVNGSSNLAKVLLQSAGLKLGRVEHTQSSLGSGLVLKQLYKGRSIAPNTLLEKGSIIDIVVSEKENFVDSSVNVMTAPDPIDNSGL
ncbi:MAG TPA: PASTA domain-containing protein [Bacteroidia bacterium]